MTIPPLPSLEWQTLFLWPGLQPRPGARNYLPIDNGVLQPVLTWGPSCAPNPTGLNENGWWISSQYVNTFGKFDGYTGCLGGSRILVKPGDSIKMVMQLEGANWIQSVENQNTNQFANFTIDMKGQDQTWAEWVMEIPGGWHDNPPQWDVRNIVLKTERPGTNICRYESKVSSHLGAQLKCDNAVEQGNICTIAHCLFNGASPLIPSTTTTTSTTTTSTTTTTTTATTTATSSISSSTTTAPNTDTLVPSSTISSSSSCDGQASTSVPILSGAFDHKPSTIALLVTIVASFINK